MNAHHVLPSCIQGGMIFPRIKKRRNPSKSKVRSSFKTLNFWVFDAWEYISAVNGGSRPSNKYSPHSADSVCPRLHTNSSHYGSANSVNRRRTWPRALFIYQAVCTRQIKCYSFIKGHRQISRLGVTGAMKKSCEEWCECVCDAPCILSVSSFKQPTLHPVWLSRACKQWGNYQQTRWYDEKSALQTNSIDYNLLGHRGMFACMFDET